MLVCKATPIPSDWPIHARTGPRRHTCPRHSPPYRQASPTHAPSDLCASAHTLRHPYPSRAPIIRHDIPTRNEPPHTTCLHSTRSSRPDQPGHCAPIRFRHPAPARPKPLRSLPQRHGYPTRTGPFLTRLPTTCLVVPTTLFNSPPPVSTNRARAEPSRSLPTALVHPRPAHPRLHTSTAQVFPCHPHAYRLPASSQTDPYRHPASWLPSARRLAPTNPAIPCQPSTTSTGQPMPGPPTTPTDASARACPVSALVCPYRQAVPVPAIPVRRSSISPLRPTAASLQAISSPTDGPRQFPPNRPTPHPALPTILPSVLPSRAIPTVRPLPSPRHFSSTGRTAPILPDHPPLSQTSPPTPSPTDCPTHVQSHPPTTPASPRRLPTTSLPIPKRLPQPNPPPPRHADASSPPKSRHHTSTSRTAPHRVLPYRLSYPNRTVSHSDYPAPSLSSPIDWPIRSCPSHPELTALSESFPSAPYDLPFRIRANPPHTTGLAFPRQTRPTIPPNAHHPHTDRPPRPTRVQASPLRPPIACLSIHPTGLPPFSRLIFPGTIAFSQSGHKIFHRRKEANMEEVEVKRADLIERIRLNRDQHRATFEKAMERYRDLAIQELDKAITEAKAGKRIARGLRLVEPEDHTDDYDRVLTMLEMDVNETVSIDEQRFAWYVLDAWSWKKQWTASTAAYVVQ